MSTFAELKDNVRRTLNDGGVNNYTDDDINSSFQEAYDDIACLTQCIIKKVTLSWVANDGYPAFAEGPYFVLDYMCTTAIFDNVTNRWLLDGLSIRDLERFRPDWELTNASPQWWASKSADRIAVFPKYATDAGTFDLYYAAVAPTIDDDTATPLIPTDKQCLLEQYATADLLETWEEFKKAAHYWKQYHDEGGIPQLASRFKNLAHSDLLLLA